MFARAPYADEFPKLACWT